MPAVVAALCLGPAACVISGDPASADESTTGGESTETTGEETGEEESTSTGDSGETDTGESEDESTDEGQDTDDPPMLCDGDPCTVFDECCDGQTCVDGTCQARTCVEEDAPCDDDLPCCGEFECEQESGTCQLPPWCVGLGETCDAFFVPCCEPLVCNTDGFIDECKMP